MFNFIDNFIENKMKNWLHGNRSAVIEDYKKKFGAVSDLEVEYDRAEAIVDRSILRARIRRGKYVFWFTALASTFIVGSMQGFSGESLLPYVTPPISALIGWVGTIGTIHIDYTERLNGALDWAVKKSQIATNAKVEVTHKIVQQKLLQHAITSSKDSQPINPFEPANDSPSHVVIHISEISSHDNPFTEDRKSMLKP